MQPLKQDDDLKKLFETARSVDEPWTPAYRVVRDNAALRARHPYPLRPDRPWRVGLTTTAACALLVISAFAFVELRYSRVAPVLPPLPQDRRVIVKEYVPPPLAQTEAPAVQAVAESLPADAGETKTLGDSPGYTAASAPAEYASNQVAGAQARLETDGLRAIVQKQMIRPGLPLAAAEPAAVAGGNTESYRIIDENDFRAVRDHALSTFSIDVDTASYANVRRYLNSGQLPPPDAVRIEELINYFSYDYPQPAGDAPFSVSVEVADCPWNSGHRLARIGLRGRTADRGEFGGSNLVFLIDVSGSMQSPDKLPLLKQALQLLADQLDGGDRVALVVYAGASGLVLPSTPGDARGAIRDAIQALESGGSTNGGAGLQLAYQVARENFIPGGINRVILATDGDFNVGVTDQGRLLRMIEEDARKGIALTALGFGTGNYKDDLMETLADRGDGNYAYIDRLDEAQKVLVQEIGGTLITIARDVKIQVEFNPREVAAYRLIGYENRLLRDEEFNDDRKDAGEIGAGHTVTALYELVPAGGARAAELPSVDPLRYQQPAEIADAAASGELFTLKLRYKEPQGAESRLLTFPVADGGGSLAQATDDFRFAAAVAAWGMLLRDSPQAGTLTFDQVAELLRETGRRPDQATRAELLDLVRLGTDLFLKNRSVPDPSVTSPRIER